MQVVQSAQIERVASEAGSPLRLLPAPPRLFVPLHSADSELITLKDIGTRVERGEALVASPQAAAFTVIAPAGGMIVGKTQAMLLNGARVAAVEISVDAAGGGDAAALRSAGPGARKSVRIIPLPNDYPQGDPTMLMLALLGRRLRPGKLPVEQNVLMVDGAAARAVGLAVAGTAMLDVPMAVRDARGGGRTHFVRALVGTPLRFVLETLRLDARDATIRAGAALRDLRVPCEAVVAGGELAMDIGPTLQPANPDPCI